MDKEQEGHGSAIPEHVVAVLNEVLKALENDQQFGLSSMERFLPDAPTLSTLSLVPLEKPADLVMQELIAATYYRSVHVTHKLYRNNSPAGTYLLVGIVLEYRPYDMPPVTVNCLYPLPGTKKIAQKDPGYLSFSTIGADIVHFLKTGITPFA